MRQAKRTRWRAKCREQGRRDEPSPPAPLPRFFRRNAPKESWARGGSVAAAGRSGNPSCPSTALTRDTPPAAARIFCTLATSTSRGRHPSCDGHRGGHARRMAGDEAVGDQPHEVGHPQFGADAAAGGQQVVDLLGHQRPVGDLPLVVLALRRRPRRPRRRASCRSACRPSVTVFTPFSTRVIRTPSCGAGLHAGTPSRSRASADLLHVLPDELAVVHLQAGQRRHVEPVDLRAVHVDPVDARHGRGAARGAWASRRRPAGGSTLSRLPMRETRPMLCVRCSNSAPAAANRSPSPVASTTILARIAWRPDLLSKTAPADRRCRSTIASTPQQCRKTLTPASSIISTMRYLTASASTVGLTPRPAVDDPAVELLQAAHHLLADALADLLAALDDVADDHEHQPAGPQAAEVAVAFHQRDLARRPVGRRWRRPRRPGRRRRPARRSCAAPAVRAAAG